MGERGRERECGVCVFLFWLARERERVRERERERESWKEIVERENDRKDKRE